MTTHPRPPRAALAFWRRTILKAHQPRRVEPGVNAVSGNESSDLLTQGDSSKDYSSPFGLNWAYMAGSIGSGKSTILRAIAADAVRAGRPVIALQLQRDNSAGYTAQGAEEVFDIAEFQNRTETALRNNRGIGQVLLAIVDGAGPDDAESIGPWARKLDGKESLQLICATNWSTAPLFPNWGDAAITVQIDEPEVRGIATGTILRHSDHVATPWEIVLPMPPHPSQTSLHLEELNR